MLIEDLTFAYGDKVIFRDLCLELPDRGVTAISGPSGCGKTTLLRLIAGLETPLSGRITAPGLENTSFLFQENRLFPGVSASSQIRAVMPRGCDVTEYLRLVGLEGEASSKPETLSGGMLRRVSLARAIAYSRDKSLLILDEPFTGVDSQTVDSIMTHLKSMPIPILLSTHDSHTLSLIPRRVTLPL